MLIAAKLEARSMLESGATTRKRHQAVSALAHNKQRERRAPKA
ncbi:hypothetical protein [Adlercreutzia sp. ZJ242]|nr:hypothetical protein [Adlercreutzia sp. ZJ242]